MLNLLQKIISFLIFPFFFNRLLLELVFLTVLLNLLDVDTHTHIVGTTMKIWQTINVSLKDNYLRLNNLCFLGRQSVKIIGAKNKCLFAPSP